MIAFSLMSLRDACCLQFHILGFDEFAVQVDFPLQKAAFTLLIVLLLQHAESTRHVRNMCSLPTSLPLHAMSIHRRAANISFDWIWLYSKLKLIQIHSVIVIQSLYTLPLGDKRTNEPTIVHEKNAKYLFISLFWSQNDFAFNYDLYFDSSAFARTSMSRASDLRHREWTDWRSPLPDAGLVSTVADGVSYRGVYPHLYAFVGWWYCRDRVGVGGHLTVCDCRGSVSQSVSTPIPVSHVILNWLRILHTGDSYKPNEAFNTFTQPFKSILFYYSRVHVSRSRSYLMNIGFHQQYTTSYIADGYDDGWTGAMGRRRME